MEKWINWIAEYITHRQTQGHSKIPNQELNLDLHRLEQQLAIWYRENCKQDIQARSYYRTVFWSLDFYGGEWIMLPRKYNVQQAIRDLPMNSAFLQWFISKVIDNSTTHHLPLATKRTTWTLTQWWWNHSRAHVGCTFPCRKSLQNILKTPCVL